MIDIDKIALLARIKLNPNEKEKLQKEFEAILGYISKLNEVDVSGIDDIEASKTIDLENIMREDVNPHESGIFSDDLMKEVPVVENGFVKVKHILE